MQDEQYCIICVFREFEVFGLQGELDREPVSLGRFSYDDDGEPLQFFAASASDGDDSRRFAFVELEILSNHGHVNYTCLYRFRVHGKP